VSHDAIIAAVMSRSPADVLGIGPEADAIIRELSDSGVIATAIDDARELVDGKLDLKVDVAVVNVLTDSGEAVEEMIRHAPRVLRVGGALIIEAVHPHFAAGDEPYRDGWRDGSPAWYFRTVESWVKVLAGAGFDLDKVVEPVHPDTGLPASIIFVASLRG
jgi:hypothetical protein